MLYSFRKPPSNFKLMLDPQELQQNSLISLPNSAETITFALQAPAHPKLLVQVQADWVF